MSEKRKWSKPEVLSLEASELTAEGAADLVPNDDFNDAAFDGFTHAGTADAVS